ncbi:sigma-54 dependent transcriptional regulator [Bacteriovorax sp. Seq25_V]|uniref:sigma-54-dependent transcriptional regulator n=1 Tax=Bacteriovorax sp. Seq25_V TaxID=1201288 RepID=UPI00038A3DF3|nr:sigma 54-interacting transcriptional regulator [Bacteriovorax sp. Seq25_V]EQC47369.1 sigma-54 interaction domain protein [Bacteriovorax sp. Seq25_V]
MAIQLSNNNPLVKESFAKIGTELEIYPVFGKKRTISLNRKILMINEKKGQFAVNPHQIKLSSISDEEQSYQLENFQDEFNEFYTLKVTKGQGFKVNGQLVKEAYCFEGDVIMIGLNKLVFKNSDKRLKKKLYSYIPKLPMLIEGETGTGKSTLAKKLHEQSSVRGDFIHINISSFPASLIESELFGHVKGAFTGAITEKLGAIRSASGGTLFIDEIDSLPLELQVKLLLFLDSKSVRPVGSDSEYHSDTNLIFASGQNLKELVKKGEMRKDFFFRISSGQYIYLPSLRENREQVAELCMEFEFKNLVTISRELISFYKDYDWPGNIRQLRGHLEKKMYLTKRGRLVLDKTDYELLDIDFDLGETEENLIYDFESYKKKFFLRAYHRCGENLSVTAKRMDVAPNTIRRVLDLAIKD